MGTTEAIGIQLSSLGFTGAENFYVSATFRPIVGIDDLHEVGVFVGTSRSEMIRAGQLTLFGQTGRFATNNVGGHDLDIRYIDFGLNAADGLTISIGRTLGIWDCFIDGVRWLPNTAFNGTGTVAPPLFLDGATDLTVGVYATNRSNSTPATYKLDSFSALVSTECDDCCENCGSTTLADFQLVSDHFNDHVPPGALGDLTFDGVVNFDDFRFWKAHYNPGAGAGATQAVAEPAGLVMFVAGMLSMNFLRCGSVERCRQNENGATVLWKWILILNGGRVC
jgi:hypothetical protein